MTQLYLEQVLIGAVGLLILALPWFPTVLAALGGLKDASSLATGSIAAGAAFLVGIPLDRLADTLTERLERHGRLIFGLTRLCGDRRRRNDAAPLDLSQDLFPEHRYQAACLRDAAAVVSWLGYHRSRLRLTRALAVYGPALTVSATLGVAPRPSPPQSWFSPRLLVIVAMLYAAWAVLLWWRTRRSSVTHDLPRTHHPQVLTYAARWGFVDDDGVPRHTSGRGPDLAVWRSEWASWLVPAIVLLLALMVAWSRGSTPARAVSVTGALLTVLSAWAWWRVGFTYRTYLADLGEPAARG